MEINEKIFINLLKANLSLDHYYLLNSIKQRTPLVAHKKVEGYVGFLEKKGWVEINKGITPDGIKILAQIEENDVILSFIENKQQSFSSFCLQLYTKLQDKLIELTGKKQKVISGKYSFLCNAEDLRVKLEKVIKRYNIKKEHFTKIEKALINHIVKSHNAKWEYTVLMEYFIEKNGSSRLITEMENVEEELNTSTDAIEKQEHISTKELF